MHGIRACLKMGFPCGTLMSIKRDLFQTGTTEKKILGLFRVMHPLLLSRHRHF